MEEIIESFKSKLFKDAKYIIKEVESVLGEKNHDFTVNRALDYSFFCENQCNIHKELKDLCLKFIDDFNQYSHIKEFMKRYKEEGSYL